MKIHYARVGRKRIAYQVVSDGPIDLVFVPGVPSHIELQWSDPSYARFLRRLASSTRLIVFDPRGSGASDPASELPTLDRTVEDIGAVMDAAGSNRAVILGFSFGGSASALFAASYPERCLGLILCAAAAKGRSAAEDPELPAAELDAMRERGRALVDHWGEGRGLELFAPSLAGSSFHRRSFGLFERATIAPERLRAIIDAYQDVDISSVLPTITMPTLVLHRTGDYVPIAHGRYIARRIPGAKFVELEGADHLPFAGDAGAIAREIESFLSELTGRVPVRESHYAVIVFSDIVSSTERIVAVGDERWRELVEAHDELVRAEVAHHGGTVVKSTGDGFLATFDGAVAAVRSAWAIREQVARVGLEIRIGVHAGECERIGDDVAGLAVHTASRIMSTAETGQILVSGDVKGLLVGAEIVLEPQGSRELKGIPGEWDLFSLAAEPPFEETAESSEAMPTREQLNLSDRVQVAIARRAPWLARSFSRAVSRVT